MSADEQATDRFQVRATSDSHFGWIRTRLALERTLMSWVRTAAGLIGFGFVIVQFFEHLNTVGVHPARLPHAPRDLGLALIGAGIVSLLVSTSQYRTYVHYLWGSQFRILAGRESSPSGRIPWLTPAVAVAIMVMLIGLFGFAAVLYRTA